MFMLKTYRTPKGTDLPLLNLRGKEYLEVKYRLVWFREDHPQWAIETELLSVNDESAYARATIKDESCRVIATSHKFENKKGFPDFIEKSETGAIGRALALIGYGTQFCADELDEGDRIVDAPVSRSTPRPASRPAASTRVESVIPSSLQAGPAVHSRQVAAAMKTTPRPGASGGSSNATASDPGDYEVSFGKKYKGLKLREIPRNELEAYLDWLEDNASKKGLPLSEEARFLKVAAGRFLQNAESGLMSNAKSGRH